MSDFDRRKFLFYIESELKDLDENEKEFIRIELEYEHTNFFRISRLVWFLKKCRTEKYKLTPTLLLIRDVYEEPRALHKLSRKIIENGKFVIDDDYDYWRMRNSFAGC